jgi:hypothetical protein
MEVSTLIGLSAFTQFIEIENCANINREHVGVGSRKLPRGRLTHPAAIATVPALK